MSALSPRGRVLVEAARTADRPSTQDRTRIRAALALQLGAAVLPGAASSASAAPAPMPSAPPVLPSVPVPVVPPLPAIPMMSGLGVKLIAAGALISAVGMGIGMSSARPRGPSLSAPPKPIAMEMETQRPLGAENRPPVVTLSVPQEGPQEGPQEDGRPPSAPSSSPLSSPARPSGSPAPVGALPVRAPAPSRASSLTEETALLREAQAALKEGDAAKSLAAVDALAARHPQGMLREERLAARVLALCAVGRVEEARAEGHRFVAEMPRSIQAERVRASCAFSPKSER